MRLGSVRLSLCLGIYLVSFQLLMNVPVVGFALSLAFGGAVGYYGDKVLRWINAEDRRAEAELAAWYIDYICYLLDLLKAREPTKVIVVGPQEASGTRH